MKVLPAGTPLAYLAELPEGGALGFPLGEDPWLRGVLVRDGTGVHAYVNRCPHAGRPLDFPPGNFLTADGELFQCKAHGALFEKSTGLCIAGPCVDEELRRLPVDVVEGQVRLAADVDLEKLQRGPW